MEASQVIITYTNKLVGDRIVWSAFAEFAIVICGNGLMAVEDAVGYGSDPEAAAQGLFDAIRLGKQRLDMATDLLRAAGYVDRTGE